MRSLSVCGLKVCAALFALNCVALPTCSVAEQAVSCKALTNQVEVLLCADPELRSLYQLVEELQEDKLLTSKAPHASRLAHQRWREGMTSLCHDVVCVKEALYSRLDDVDAFARKPTASQTLPLSGTWRRVDPTGFEGASLTITDEVEDSFKFSLIASNGARSGDYSGVAKRQSRSDALYSGDVRCSMLFRVKWAEGQRALTVQEQGCTDIGGVGVSFAGEYRLLGEAEQPLSERRFLTDESLNAKFRELVGESYLLFLGTAHLASQLPDLDGFGALVQAFSVRSLSRVNESIVMSTPSGAIWAAVIEPVDGSSPRPRVRYFTNHPEWSERIPVTIAEWRATFKEYPIVNGEGGEVLALQSELDGRRSLKEIN
jgi:uncharacterized protein